jgi:hypothetical protein
MQLYDLTGRHRRREKRAICTESLNGGIATHVEGAITARPRIKHYCRWGCGKARRNCSSSSTRYVVAAHGDKFCNQQSACGFKCNGCTIGQCVVRGRLHVC